MNYTITRTKGGVIAWTDEQVAYIIKKYQDENYTLKKLGREFGCNYNSIRNLLNKHNIQSRGNKNGYPRDEYYFLNIDTPDKAYWLGFLYADGCVHEKDNTISINITDKEHVQKFLKAIGAINHKITETKDERFPKSKMLYQASIRDLQLHTDLIKWGCVPNKSLVLVSIPNIPRNYVNHFIRGYFDGDGSLHYLKNSNNYRISFVGTFKFLQDIQKELLVTNISIRHQSSGQAFELQISGRKQVCRILNYLYENSTTNNRLDRKYLKYLDCLNWAHSR